MNMPLKTKKILSGLKQNGSNTKASSKKIGIKTNGKTTISGNKPCKKPPRTKAGYALYSSDSTNPHLSHLTNACGEWGASRSSESTSLVEEWMVKQMHISEAEAGAESHKQNQQNYCAPRNGAGDTRTPFNKRLASSTPDPEKFVDEDSPEQFIPERDIDLQTDLKQSAHISAAKKKVGITLTESQRNQLRQKIDEVLMRERQNLLSHAQKDNRTSLQPHLEEHENSLAFSTNANQQHVCVLQQTDTVIPSQRKSNSKFENFVEACSEGLNSISAQATWHDLMKENSLDTRESDIGIFHHFLHRDSDSSQPPVFQGEQANKISVNGQVFLPEIVTRFAPNATLGFVPVGEQTSKFVPMLSGNFSSPNSTSHDFQPLTINTELMCDGLDVGKITDWSDTLPGLVHMATHSSSPVRQMTQGSADMTSPRSTPTLFNSKKKSLSLKEKNTLVKKSKNSKTAVFPQALQTPASSPEEIYPKQCLVKVIKDDAKETPSIPCLPDNLPSPHSRAIRGRGSEYAAAEHAAPSSVQTKIPLQKGSSLQNSSQVLQATSSADNYTCDGYYINRPFSEPHDCNESPPMPRAFTPTPMHSPVLQRAYFGDSGQEVLNASNQNCNNNSDNYTRKRDSEPNLQQAQRPSILISAAKQNQVRVPPRSSGQSKNPREAMADEEFASVPGTSLVKAAMMMVEDDPMDPPAPSPSPTPAVYANREVLNGPRKLRFLINELKETCAIDVHRTVVNCVGDMETGQLVQEISNLVDILPQLKVTFNLQAEIDLAMQPLRNENSQLRRRLRIVNQQLKERERQEREGFNPGLNFEMLHLQTDNASLQRQLKEEREGCKKLNQYISEHQVKLDKANSELQCVKCKLGEMEHEKLLQRQEQTQNLKHLHQELEMMSRRNESVQLKLSSADRENNILQLNIKQRDIEIARLQTAVGNLKQGVSEVLQYFDQSMGDLNSTDQGIQRLLGFLKASSQSFNNNNNPQKFDSVSCDKEPLDLSGNKRVRKAFKPDKERGDLAKSEAESAPSSHITIAALAAHNRQMDAALTREDSFSLHSWDGLDRYRFVTENQNRPVLYYSDPESSISHQRKGGDLDSGGRLSHRLPDPPDKRLLPETAKRKGDYKKEGRHSENFDTVKESDAGCTNEKNSHEALSTKHVADSSRYSVTDYFKKYPYSPQIVIRAKSPKHDTIKPFVHDSPPSSPPVEKAAVKPSPPISSPNSTLTLNSMDLQKDYFQGTELDLSLSTIQEDGASTLTGITGASVSTAMSLDDQVFREGIAALDENIAKVHEALQRTKKMFS